MKQYTFCETIHASAASPWHIRESTKAGKKLGCVADTPSLCGRKVSWDIGVEFSLLFTCCNTCRAVYEDKTKDRRA